MGFGASGRKEPVLSRKGKEKKKQWEMEGMETGNLRYAASSCFKSNSSTQKYSLTALGGEQVCVKICSSSGAGLVSEPPLHAEVSC
jgi:hypothetical protein